VTNPKISPYGARGYGNNVKHRLGAIASPYTQLRSKLGTQDPDEVEAGASIGSDSEYCNTADNNQNRPFRLGGAGITNPATSRAVAIFFAAGRNAAYQHPFFAHRRGYQIPTLRFGR
jgi:hypothetical protein